MEDKKIKTIKEDIEHLTNKAYDIEEQLNQYEKDIDYMRGDIQEIIKQLENIDSELIAEENSENK